MDKAKLKKLSTEDLKKKEQGTKTLIGIFIPIILGLAYFSFRDYMDGDVDMASVTIAICAVGGMVSLFPGLKAIRAELAERA